MSLESDNQRRAALENWIKIRFTLTGADEIHFSSFDRIFRRCVEDVRKESNADPVTDHFAMLDPSEPEEGTGRNAVETGTQERFRFYLLARDAQHGTDYAEIFAWIHDGYSDVEKSSVEAYWELSQKTPEQEVNPAWADARETCIRLGHNEAYAEYCANELLENNFSLAQAHKSTAQFFKDFQSGIDRGYSERRATMFAEYQSLNHDGRSAQIAEIFSRIVEEKLNQGYSRVKAEIFARHYADEFDVDGQFYDEDEQLYSFEATLRAEAKCRFRAVIMMARRMISLENSKTSLEKFHRIKEDRKLGLMK